MANLVKARWRQSDLGVSTKVDAPMGWRSMLMQMPSVGLNSDVVTSSRCAAASRTAVRRMNR
ncbi:hypothetical protein ACFQVC_28530 [Streptomyces monticola]|uniref:Uncharacterized protein n=1 Tax=Streptomyces monticola TaxID=2666263 RepID=A0ABW2JQD7_9ACTN